MPGTQWGTGGMATKLTAARLATAAGCHMVICQGSQPEQISAILRGERAGTVFYPHLQALKCARHSQQGPLASAIKGHGAPQVILKLGLPSRAFPVCKAIFPGCLVSTSRALLLPLAGWSGMLCSPCVLFQVCS